MKHPHDIKYFLTGCFAVLMLTVLSACGGGTSDPTVSETAQESVSAQKTVTVSTVEELAEAMENDTCVILKEGVYNFSKLDYSKVETTALEEPDYPSVGEYIIRKVRGLSLIAEEGAAVELVTENCAAVVLDFMKCSDITLKGLTVGHAVEPGTCDGDVIGISYSWDVRIEDCHLYGCGTYGLGINSSENITVTGTDIYECSNGIFHLYDVEDVVFDDCRFYHNSGWNLFTMSECRDTVIRNTEVYENDLTWPDGYEPIWTEGECDVLFQNCVFRDNAMEPDVQWLTENTQIVFENCEVPEPDSPEVYTGYARNQPIDSDDYFILEINEACVVGPDDRELRAELDIDSLDEAVGRTVVVTLNDDYFPYLAKKGGTYFYLQEYDSYSEDYVPVWVSWEEFLYRIAEEPDGELLVTYELAADTERGYPVIASISEVVLPSNEIPTADPTMTRDDLVGRWSLTGYEVDGYFEDTSEYGLENSFTFVLQDDGSILASHIEEYSYGGVTEITDAPVEFFETYSDYILFQRYGIPWLGELDMTGQPMSDTTAVWERYSVGLIDENTLLVHYVAETTAEPYMISVAYYYGKVDGAGG